METTEKNNEAALLIKAVKKGVEDGKNVYDLTGNIDMRLPFEDKFKLIKALLFQSSVLLSQSIAEEIKNGHREEIEEFVPQGREEISLAMDALINLTFNI